jgi:hypothetical protein
MPPHPLPPKIPSKINGLQPLAKLATDSKRLVANNNIDNVPWKMAIQTGNRQGQVSWLWVP